jgi:hypothetical protein
MWNSVFRPQIQTYLPACMTSFITIRSVYSEIYSASAGDDQMIDESMRRVLEEVEETNDQFIEPTTENIFRAIFKLSLLSILPWFSYFYLKRNYSNLDEEIFCKKFGTLY